MAFFQRASKLAFPTAGAAVAASTTSFLLGGSCRQYSLAANQKLSNACMGSSRQLQKLVANRAPAHPHPPSRFTGQHLLKHQQKFSSVAKEAAATAPPQPTNKGFVEWYEGHLKSRPVTTKAITGSILWGVGDVVAQVAPTFFGDATTSADGQNVIAKYDLPRTARAITFGFALHAPLAHLHYNFLELMTVRAGFQGLSIPVFKTIMEQFVYWSWISNSLYHGAMGAMQGMNFTQIYHRIADVLWDTQVAQWSFWIPVQLLNFQFVPVRHQLNVVLVTSIVWTALLSAWYPPESEEKDSKDSAE